MAVSAVMVEAYKKFILVGLIARGSMPSLPAYRSPIVQRIVKQSCQEYVKLVSIYTGLAQVPFSLLYSLHLFLVQYWYMELKGLSPSLNLV